MNPIRKILCTTVKDTAIGLASAAVGIALYEGGSFVYDSAHNRFFKKDTKTPDTTDFSADKNNKPK